VGGKSASSIKCG